MSLPILLACRDVSLKRSIAGERYTKFDEEIVLVSAQGEGYTKFDEEIVRVSAQGHQHRVRRQQTFHLSCFISSLSLWSLSSSSLYTSKESIINRSMTLCAYNRWWILALVLVLLPLSVDRDYLESWRGLIGLVHEVP